MEIARLEVSTQQHLERMQETAKVNYIQYGKSPKASRGRNHSLVQGQVTTGVPNPVEKAKGLHFCQTPSTDVGKADTKRHRTAKLWTQHAEDVERKDTLRRFASRGNAPHTLGKLHRLPPPLQGQGPVNPSTLMMEDNQYTLIWSVSPM